MVIWIVTGIFALLSIVLLTGKGGFLIAGYNTANEKERARYNEKRLCRVMGTGMLLLTLILFLETIYHGELPKRLDWLMPWGVFAVVIGLVVVTNSSFCERKDKCTGTLTEEEQRSRTLQKRVVLVVVAVVLAFAGFMLYSGDVKISFQKEQMTIDTFMVGKKTLDYDDITSVEYTDELNIGSRSMGVGSKKLQAGSFRNKEFGNYRLYSYTRCKEYIVIDTVNGVVVMNGKAPKETKKLYEKICDKVEE